MRHRSITAVVFMAILFLGSARQADAQVYFRVGTPTPVTYTTYYPDPVPMYPYTRYVYPTSSYYPTYSYPMTPSSWTTGYPIVYDNTYWDGGYRTIYTDRSWRGHGWRR